MGLAGTGGTGGTGGLALDPERMLGYKAYRAPPGSF